jgi:MarR family transcriptional regulator, organic hydroperoxide resistance regulator
VVRCLPDTARGTFLRRSVGVNIGPTAGLRHPGLDGVDELSSRVFGSLLDLFRLHRQLMTKSLAAYGTHPGQAMCLHLLAVRDGTTQRDLADSLRLSRPTVSKMVRAMERSGLVVRRPDEDDQRLTRVDLTSAGRELERELRVVAVANVNRTIGVLPADDRGELERLLAAVAASISRAIDAQPGPRPGALPARPEESP